MSELKNCAHCGSSRVSKKSEPHPEKVWNMNRVGCDTCRVSTGLYLSEADAVTAWNTRSDDRPKDAGKRVWGEIKDLQKRVEALQKQLNEHTQKPPPGMQYPGADGYCPHLGCTMRSCLDCNSMVAGGPTRCNRCALEAKQ